MNRSLLENNWLIFLRKKTFRGIPHLFCTSKINGLIVDTGRQTTGRYLLGNYPFKSMKMVKNEKVVAQGRLQCRCLSIISREVTDKKSGRDQWLVVKRPFAQK